VTIEVKCPACEAREAKRVGDAVAVYRTDRGVTEKKLGHTYGCLRCGILYTVTASEVFAARGPSVRKPEPNGTPDDQKGSRVTRQSDPDLIMSPEQMR